MKNLTVILLLFVLFLGILVFLILPNQTNKEIPLQKHSYILSISSLRDGEPLQNTSISLENSIYYSDSNGKYELTSDTEKLTITLFKINYYPLKTEIIPGQNNLTLKKIPESSALINLTSDFLTFFTSKAFYFKDNEPATGLVKIYSESNLLIGQQETENGLARFDNVPPVKGYATVEENGLVLDKENYYLPSTVYLNVNSSDSLNSDVVQTNFSLTPDNSYVNLQIFDSNSQLVYDGGINGTLNLILKPGFYFYTAFTDYKILSKRFEAGIQIILDFTNVDNSTLNDTTQTNETITTSTELPKYYLTLKSETNSSITLFHNDQKIFEKTFNNKLTLFLDKGIYYLKSFYQNNYFEKTIDLKVDTVIPITYARDLNFNYYLSLTDGLNKIDGTITISNSFLSNNCQTNNGECVFNLPPSTYQVKVTSPKFSDLKYTLELTSDLYDKKTLTKPEYHDLLFKGILQRGFKKVDLDSNNNYELQFQITGGKYLLISFDSDKLVFNKNNLYKFKEFYLSKSSKTCSSSSSNQLIIKTPENDNDISIFVDTLNSSEDETIQLNYYLFDSTVDCKPTISRSSQLLLKGITKNKTQQQNNESENQIFIEDNHLKTSLKEINFILDPVFPADSQTLKLPDEITFRVEGPNANCFSFNANSQEKNIVLKSKSFDSSCNIIVYENQAEGINQNNAIFSYKGQKLTLPLQITFKKLKSIYYDDVSPYYSSNAKLFPIINNRQVASQYKLNDKTVTFSSPNVKLMVLTQPNIYSFKDSNEEKLFDLDLRHSDSFFDYDSICKSESKTCYTGFCCLTTCCSLDQAQVSLSKFKEKARQTSLASAFRRGNGKPLNLISDKTSFEFYTVISKKKGVSLGLGDSSDLPSFEIVKFESNDFQEKITSTTATINQNDYYSGKCSSINLTGFTLSNESCIFSEKASNADLDQEDDSIKVKFIETSFPTTKDPLYVCSSTNIAKIADVLGLPGASKEVCDAADKTVKFIPHLELSSSSDSLINFIPRTTFARCYQPSIALPCKPVCRPKKAFNLIIVENNEYKIIQRDGISTSCGILRPAALFSEKTTVSQLRDLLKSQTSDSLFKNSDTIVAVQSLCDYGFDFTKIINGITISDEDAAKLYLGIDTIDVLFSFVNDVSKNLCSNIKPNAIDELKNKYSSYLKP